MTLEQPDGGANYYAHSRTHSRPTRPTSRSVFGAPVQPDSGEHGSGCRRRAEPSRRASYTPLVPAIRADGRFRTMQYYDQDGTVNGSEKTGTILSDEIDMQQSDAAGAAAARATLNQRLASLPADGQMRVQQLRQGRHLLEQPVRCQPVRQRALEPARLLRRLLVD